MGHKWAAAQRGYHDAFYHDQAIIDNWNSVVDKKDTVYVLGDVTMEKADYDFFEQLKGYKKVILGNHDKPAHVPEMLKYVNSVAGVYDLRVADVRVWLTHTPMHNSEIYQDHSRSVNVHGHIHEKPAPSPYHINVSCDVVGLTPQPLTELIIKWKHSVKHKSELK